MSTESGEGGEGGQARRWRGITVTLGSPALEESVPLITCAAPDGFACGVRDIDRYAPTAAGSIKAISAAMKDGAFGALVAVVSPPLAARPLILVQDSRGLFYRSNDTGDAGWKDFYYATAWVAFSEAERRWGATEIELHHPSHSPWPPNVLPAAMGALGHLQTQRTTPRLRHVHLEACGSLDEARLDEALECLGSQNTHRRPLDVHPFPLERLGLRPVEGVELLQVLVPRTGEPASYSGRTVLGGRAQGSAFRLSFRFSSRRGGDIRTSALASFS